MALTDLKIKGAKPRAKKYKMADGKGLFIVVMPNGSKYWHYRFQFAGKPKSLPLGVYPNVGLKEARTKHQDAVSDVASGVDPTAKRKAEKLLRSINTEDTFKAVALEWHSARIAQLTEKYSAQVLRILNANVFPQVGSRRIREITAPELLAALRLIEDRAALVTAHTVRSYCSQIFRFAIAVGKAERDIAADLRGALKVPNRRHFTSLDERDLPEFLQKLFAYDGDAQTQRALQLVIYTLVRTSDMRGARWSEINFEQKTWLIPAERMKMKEKHIVPLSSQALELFDQQRRSTGNHEFVFSNRHRPTSCMSENTMLFAIYRMGYHGRATTHGFRSTGSTILNEQGFNRDHIERQLAHSERDKVRASYNYAQYLPQRTSMMQHWADYVDAARGGIGRSSQLGQIISCPRPLESWYDLDLARACRSE